jgi:hypothetical protein
MDVFVSVVLTLFFSPFYKMKTETKMRASTNLEKMESKEALIADGGVPAFPRECHVNN